MSKRVNNAVRYKYPLPVHPIELPQLIIHNPVSWAYWSYCYLTGCNALQRKIHVDIIGEKIVHIEVRNQDDMKYLWENGFFGTGQLSRSEPTWYNHMKSKFQNENNESINKNISLEQVTKLRRQQRIEFKKQREVVEAKLLELRKKGELTPEEEARILEQERGKLRKFKDDQVALHLVKEDPTENVREKGRLLIQEAEVIGENGEIIQMETLELMPVETIFLSFALDVLDITPSKFIIKCCMNDSFDYTDELHKLLIQYTAYHHYRSHGWCVRSGIKFGSDYILYKRGPPFQHADFCIMVLNSNCSNPYTWYSTIARVCGGANKSLVLCYVERTNSKEQIIKWVKEDNLSKVFNSFSVGEIIFKRWVPGKNRD
ncbi:similar to Saccharomyces cerevisiae YLR105C SEN2 Subunit of the tRNA splicing endonuclease, which is composed of Sen2p, Sen15p, Sen34p, and Sen54p [Maudiozyma barnettii]|uniref:tRNA-splicing endonuclease subunit Sen2 n=1 Tax=Maudiozyma barnettii TaxID=61262 RepID=A0A8H2VHB1_9SACH|nr:tRNA splicing endonuclease subunit SEN2 [Kazachstania barnettii]CAB4255466.1 similar to Saccharomyces cerevisiae YLR105C SEN2 Subunit of the tRNA splicing endonuclease, which is composed of Sen2p, Sen15p, Sen34p, and Sen54p [Kazachstania barnettii]CAD1783935.1 similar to Saccharomyces cerevisiae YLR105C SEN2 Subunit of the tRNA splicing endonuclease, which is composed of Sen2p, Sen15p, Sen34p, and Sen54p [Kazachstania barnettii]